MSTDPTPNPLAPLCTACGTALEPVAAATDVTHGTVAALATTPVGWRCPEGAARGDGHDDLTPDDDDVRAALDQGLVVARRTRLRGTLRCGECDTPFALPGRRTTRSVTITHDGPAVTVTFDLPVLRCTQDAVDNVPPEALDDATSAVAELLRGATT